MKNVLVTGGAGFIGSNVVQLLIENDCNVRILDDLSTGDKRNVEGMDVEFIRGDIRDADLVKQSCQGCEVIFHLAASVGRQKSIQYPQADSETNLIGTVNVLEGVRESGAQTIVYSSSASIFGELLTFPISEDHPEHPDSPYGVSKLAAEKQVLCFAGLYGFRAVCLRYFNVYGKNQRYDAYANVIPIFAERLHANQPMTIYGDGEQTRDFVNVADVARANFLAAEKSTASGAYNIGSGENITINRLAQMMKDLSGVNVNIHYAPKRPADVLHCLADIHKAQAEMGYRPRVPLPEGLREYLEWYQAESL